MGSIVVAPIHIKVPSRNHMQDIAERLRLANFATSGCGLQMSHESRCTGESSQAGRTIMLVAAVAVVTVGEVGFEILTERALVANSFVSNSC